MSDPRSSGSSRRVGGGRGGSGLVRGVWAGPGGVGSGDRRGETPFCPCPDTEMPSQAKVEHAAWCFPSVVDHLGKSV